MFSGYPTILWDMQGCSYTNSCFCEEGKQVRHADGFQWKMCASIYLEQKIIVRCNLLVNGKIYAWKLNKRSMSAGVLQEFS